MDAWTYSGRGVPAKGRIGQGRLFSLQGYAMKPIIGSSLLLSTLVLILFGTGNVLSSQPSSTTTTQSSSIVRWHESSQGSDKFLKDGAVIKVLTESGVTVAVSLRDTGWKMRADIMITNNTERRFDVLPEMFTLHAVTPPNGRWDPQEGTKSLAYQAPEKLAKSIRRRAGWVAALSAVGGSMETQESKSVSSTEGDVRVRDKNGNSVSGTYSGTTTTTTRSPNYAARERWNEQATNAIRGFENTISYMFRITLKSNTVMPGQDVLGAVYFEREKRSREGLLRIPINNITFEFPYTWGSKKFEGPSLQ